MLNGGAKAEKGLTARRDHIGNVFVGRFKVIGCRIVFVSVKIAKDAVHVHHKIEVTVTREKGRVVRSRKGDLRVLEKVKVVRRFAYAARRIGRTVVDGVHILDLAAARV